MWRHHAYEELCFLPLLTLIDPRWDFILLHWVNFTFSTTVHTDAGFNTYCLLWVLTTVTPGGSEWIMSVGDYVDNTFNALGSSDPREIRLELYLVVYDFSFSICSSPFCFLLTVFSVVSDGRADSTKWLDRTSFFVSAVLPSTLILLFSPSSSVSLSYFNLGSHARVFGTTLVHEFISYSHTEWN